MHRQKQMLAVQQEQQLQQQKQQQEKQQHHHHKQQKQPQQKQQQPLSIEEHIEKFIQKNLLKGAFDQIDFLQQQSTIDQYENNLKTLQCIQTSYDSVQTPLIQQETQTSHLHTARSSHTSTTAQHDDLIPPPLSPAGLQHEVTCCAVHPPMIEESSIGAQVLLLGSCDGYLLVSTTDKEPVVLLKVMLVPTDTETVTDSNRQTQAESDKMSGSRNSGGNTGSSIGGGSNSTVRQQTKTRTEENQQHMTDTAIHSKDYSAKLSNTVQCDMEENKMNSQIILSNLCLDETHNNHNSNNNADDAMIMMMCCYAVPQESTILSYDEHDDYDDYDKNIYNNSTPRPQKKRFCLSRGKQKNNTTQLWLYELIKDKPYLRPHTSVVVVSDPSLPHGLNYVVPVSVSLTTFRHSHVRLLTYNR
eukprot:GHVQ01002062.1.p1 GENE.GHVQ01002062.1~~GHVQ01002062.1.p1  ORF type:complete len:415 (-),score=106.86 GHVQ01002062.1:746-1990(-)